MMTHLSHGQVALWEVASTSGKCPVMCPRYLSEKRAHDFPSTDEGTEGVGISFGTVVALLSTEGTEGTDLGTSRNFLGKKYMFTRAVPSLLRLAGLNVCMCTRSTSVNDNPFSSVKNPANDTLNESDVDRLKSAEFDILPKPFPALCCVALLDNCKEQDLWFLEVELRRRRYVDLDDPLKFSKERLKYHVRWFVLGSCIAINGCLILIMINSIG